MRQLLLCFLVLFFSVELYPQVLLNEFSSSNISKLTDEDGDFSDWIELYNNSASGINLAGYYLSDNPSYLKKWTIPAVFLKPYSHLLIFASGKNRTELPETFKTVISRNAEWQYIVPVSETGNSWKNIGFDASSWNTGSAGFGYGDNDDSTVLNNISSVFIRKEFTVTNLQNIQELVLSIDYDDGFVAYINGHEIARNNLGTISPVPYNLLTGSLTHEATMYLGGLPENYFVRDPKTFLNEGVNVIAIQGHNSDPASSDFSLIPMLTVGRLESGAEDSVPDYISLKGRELHTNFKISDEGETLILSRPDSSVVDSVSPVPMPADLSYGRKPDGADTWLYFALSTPGSPNTTKGFNSLNSDSVRFSAAGGYYPGGVSIELSSDGLSDSIYYTLDGSEPTLLSTRYLSPFYISGGSVVRARSIKSNRLPGAITTNSYVTKRHKLPVVCLSTDPANLWDYNTGIYVLGPNASPDSPYFGANFWEDWERRAHMELYDANGVRQIDQDIGIKIFGAYSRAFPQKSLALFARKEYGKGSFDYKVFSDKPIEKFESLILRNAGNDWGQAMLRDGLTSTIIRDMDVDRQAYQPAVIYLNGEYWGILDIREKVNPDFLAENHFVNPDDVNLLEAYGSTLEGNNIAYTDLTNYLNNNTLETDQKYQQVSSKIDLNSYMQYQMTQIYVNNKDWPGNNIKFWNTNEPGSLWRWIIYDTDFGFSIWEPEAYSFNTLAFALEPNGPGWPNPPWATLLFRRMTSNKRFRDEFANQFADRLNTNFTSESVNFIIDSLKQVFLPEINDHLTRWELSYDNWQYNYTNIKNFATFRPYYSRNYLRSEFNLGKTLNIKVETDDPGTGYVKINSIIPKSYPFTGVYFKDLPIKLTAIPATGYKFVKWQMGSLLSNDITIDYSMAEPGYFKAVFEPAGDSDNKIVINEINYNSLPTRDTKDWVELLNAGRSTVNLKNWIISDGGPEAGFVFPSDYILAPGMYVVVCRDMEAFKQFCPKVSNTLGDFEFGLSSSGDDVNLYDSDGNLIDFVRFATTAPWPANANGTGLSIELSDPLSDNNNGSNWKSGKTGGTPGAVNFQTVPDDPTDGPTTTSCSLMCYPNPFTDYTTLRLEVAEAGRYRIEIYDIQGKPVRVLADQSIESGEYYIDWDGSSNNNSPLPGGVYIIKLYGEKQHFSLKVIILR
jgi:hypothetical protein